MCGEDERAREQREPLRPVSAQLEEVVEVREADRLELGDQLVERRLADDGADGDELTFDAELLVGEAEPFVEAGARQADALERVLTEQQSGTDGGDGKRHRTSGVRCLTHQGHRPAAHRPAAGGEWYHAPHGARDGAGRPR